MGDRVAQESCEADTLSSLAAIKASGGTVIAPMTLAAAGHQKSGTALLDTHDELMPASR